MRRLAGIYMITNTVNGKRYVGQSASIGDRWLAHLSSLRRGVHGNRYLQGSWNKHGEDAFSISILELTDKNSEALCEAEQRWMDYLNPEYNLAPVAGSTLGVKHPPRSADFRERMREMKSGFRHSPETIQLLKDLQAQSTYRHSPEMCRQISASLTGKPFVMTEARRRNYDSRKGVVYPEAIEAMRKANIGREVTQETREKIGRANKGKRLGAKHKPETIEKIRAASTRPRPDVGDALRGRKRPPHVVEALKAANAIRWAGNVARIREAIAADPTATTTTISKRIKADWATVRKYQKEYRDANS